MDEVAAPQEMEARVIADATAPALLAWYDRHRRTLPWRSPAGSASDPYAVWLSEIMLQQTTVAAVRPYFAAFLQKWPDVRSLAAAPLDDVLRAWAGLGYYSRARNLHACARHVVEVHGGTFPADEKGLRGLPGVGAYTAAAVAAIAFGRRAVVVDGNVERVMARLFAIAEPLPGARPVLRDAMDRVTPSARVGDFAQATMDLGATVCTPRNPLCGLCPLNAWCRAFRRGQQLALPVKAAKKAVPRRGGAVIVIRRDDGAVLVRQRPATGLFGGMTEFPSTAWSPDFDGSEMPRWPDGLPAVTGRTSHIGEIEHGLTHFTLTLQVHVAHVSTERSDPAACRSEGSPPTGARTARLQEGSEAQSARRGGDTGLAKVSASHEADDNPRWITPDALASEALPTLMRKVWAKVEAAERLSAPGLPAGDQAVMPLDDPRGRLPPSRAQDGIRTRRRPRRTGRQTRP